MRSITLRQHVRPGTGKGYPTLVSGLGIEQVIVGVTAIAVEPACLTMPAASADPPGVCGVRWRKEVSCTCPVPLVVDRERLRVVLP
jgi:hypothetical protein